MLAVPAKDSESTLAVDGVHVHYSAEPISDPHQGDSPTSKIAFPHQGNVQFKAQVTPVTLTDINPELVARFRAFLEVTQPSDQPAKGSWINYISSSAQGTLDDIVHSGLEIQRIYHSNPNWREWPREEFCQIIGVLCPRTTTALAKTPIQCLQSLKGVLNIFDDASLIKFISNTKEIFQAQTMLEKGDTSKPSELPSMVRILYNRMREVSIQEPQWRFLQYVVKQIGTHAASQPALLSDRLDLITFIHRHFNDYSKARVIIDQVDGSFRADVKQFSKKRPRDYTPQNANSHHRQGRKPTVESAAPRSQDRRSCNHCGQSNHETAHCRYAKSLGANWNSNISYWSSRACEKNGHKPFRPKQGSTEDRYAIIEACTANADPVVLFSKPLPTDIDLIIDCDNHYLRLSALIDSGCVGGNFGSIALANVLEKCGLIPIYSDDSVSVCSIFLECKRIIKSFLINTTGLTLTTNLPMQLKIGIVDIQPNLIIGRETIFRYNLLSCIQQNHINGQQHASLSLQNDTQNIKIIDKNTVAVGEVFTNVSRTASNFAAVTIAANDSIKQGSISSSDDIPESIQAIYVREHKSKYLKVESPLELESFEVQGAVDIDGNCSFDQITIVGPLSLQHGLRQLLLRYREIFQPVLTKQPAKVPPFRIEVDNLPNWERTANRRPARIQTLEKQAEIDRQVNILLTAGIIEPCQASYWSQVVLARKATDKWRLCIDYRNLNETTRQHGWPLPVINSTLKAIGEKRPKYFAILDLTSGYHQMPLAIEGRQFSAFITARGLFQFKRVAFGLKSAPAYFQYTMQVHILKDLVGNICEVYLDDIIIFGETNVQFLANVEAVLIRLRQAGVLAKPEKSRLGLTEIEYVGHVINNEGISFSKEKLQKVLQFTKPTSIKTLRSFLGLANYFRDHVYGFASLTRPLNKLLTVSKSSKSLKWDILTETAFDTIRTQIFNCPMLYFVDPKRELFLHTDASDYGVGGYLFQYKASDNVVEDNKIELPIAFCSVALSQQQISGWCTTEKEAFSIIFSIKKFHAYLRDRHFILRTDHRNLTYMERDSASKVARWKLMLQAYDFSIEHIPGKANVIADYLSRDQHAISNPSNEVITSGDNIPALNTASSVINAVTTHIISNEHYDTIAKVHNSIIGHHGIAKTISKLKRQHKQWVGIHKDVRTFIANCPNCQKMNYTKTPANVEKFTLNSQAPMQSIHIDSIGPLPADSYGHQYIIVIIDAFSRFVELFPTTSLESKWAAKAIIQFVGRYGTPMSVRSDNGSQFKDAFKQALITLKIDHVLTIPHSHQENAIVERANKEVMRHLRHFLLDDPILKQNWTDCLPLVQRIINSTRHESIGVAPATVVYGAGINLDNRLLEQSEQSHYGDINSTLDYVEKMKILQQKIIEMVRQQQYETNTYRLFPDSTSANKRKRKVAAETSIAEFNRGDQVLVNYPDNAMGNKPPNKLLTHLKGPFKVLSHEGPKYTVENPTTRTTEAVHISRLRPFNYDPNNIDPQEVARKDLNMYVVEKIIRHKGKLTGPKALLLFLVRWQNCPPEEDTWEPWSSLYKTVAMQEYLHRIGKPQIIPKHIKVSIDTDAVIK